MKIKVKKVINMNNAFLTGEVPKGQVMEDPLHRPQYQSSSSTTSNSNPSFGAPSTIQDTSHAKK